MGNQGISSYLCMRKALGLITNIGGEAGWPEVEDPPLLNLRRAGETSDLASKQSQQMNKWTTLIYATCNERKTTMEKRPVFKMSLFMKCPKEP